MAELEGICLRLLLRVNSSYYRLLHVNFRKPYNDVCLYSKCIWSTCIVCVLLMYKVLPTTFYIWSLRSGLISDIQCWFSSRKIVQFVLPGVAEISLFSITLIICLAHIDTKTQRRYHLYTHLGSQIKHLRNLWLIFRTLFCFIPYMDFI